MSNTHDIICALVRQALWIGSSEPLVSSGEKVSSEVVALCARQGVGALVYPLVMMNHPMRMQMMSVCVQTMQQQVSLQHTLTQAWNALKQAGIQPILMKGVGLAALYPEPHMRPWGDIDLFVGKKQYHPACAVMRDTFPKALKFDEELDHYKHYNLIADGISIEIHRVSVGLQHPIDEYRYARIEAQGMNQGELLAVEGLELKVPEPTFNALFVFLHAWEHMLTDGANMRQLCDLALLLHHNTNRIDKRQLRKNLRALHLTDVWQLFMSILVNHLGMPEEEALFYNKDVWIAVRAERLLNDLLDGRLVAPKTKDETPKSKFVRKVYTMRTRLLNASRIEQYSKSYARHMRWETWLHGMRRLFAKDRHWE